VIRADQTGDCRLPSRHSLAIAVIRLLRGCSGRSSDQDAPTLFSGLVQLGTQRHQRSIPVASLMQQGAIITTIIIIVITVVVSAQSRSQQTVKLRLLASLSHHCSLLATSGAAVQTTALTPPHPTAANPSSTNSTNVL